MRCTNSIALVLVAVASFVATLSLAQDVDPNTYRLPSNVVPEHYDVELDVSSNEQFSGRASIEVRVLPEKPKPKPVDSQKKRKGLRLGKILKSLGCFGPIKNSVHDDDDRVCQRGKQIVVHAGESLSIDSVRVQALLDLRQDIRVLNKTYDAATQFLTLELDGVLTPGTRVLIKFNFHSSYNSQLRGLYTRNQILDNGSGIKERYVASLFQPTYARLVFPCFDEPAMKATFRLTVKHQANELALSNTMAETQTVADLTTFEQTPRMSVHMVGLVVGQFEMIETSRQEDEPLVQFYTPKFKSEHATFARNVARQSINLMQNYTGVKFPLKRMVLVALPERELDNTEQWGLAIIRSNLTLLDDETRDEMQLTIAINVAHVIVHQWFANLITCDWWDSIWITEGIAAQRAFELVREMFPDSLFTSDYFVRLATLSGVLTKDAHVVNGLTPVMPDRKDLMTSDQIYKVFDVLGYMKSASLFTLIEEDRGYEGLRDAMRYLIRDHAYGNVNVRDLNKAFEQTNAGFKYMGNFITQLHRPGWPVFYIDSRDNQTLWIESLRMRPRMLQLYFNFHGITDMNSARIRAEYFVDFEMYQPHWFNLTSPDYYFIVNARPRISTFYRVHYADKLIEMNFREPIEQQRIDPLARLALIDDATGLAITGQMPPQSFAKWLKLYQHEDHCGVILGLLAASKAYAQLNLGTTPVKDAIFGVYQRFGFQQPKDRSFINLRTQMTSLTSLVAAGVEPVIKAALKKFDKQQGPLKELNLREPVYAAVVAHGSQKQVQKLLDHLSATRSYDEKVRLVSALSNSKSKDVVVTLVEKLVEISLPADTKLMFFNRIKAGEFADKFAHIKPEDLIP